jgi:hypothetical protein
LNVMEILPKNGCQLPRLLQGRPKMGLFNI